MTIPALLHLTDPTDKGDIVVLFNVFTDASTGHEVAILLDRDARLGSVYRMITTTATLYAAIRCLKDRQHVTGFIPRSLV